MEIVKIQHLCNQFFLHYIGINSRKIGTKVVDKDAFDNLKILANSGEFNFRGDPEKFKLFAEAERIRSAYQSNPLYAVNCSIVDPLPHQIEAVSVRAKPFTG